MGTEPVWEMNGILPNYYGGITSQIDEISSKDELIKVLMNPVLGKTYRLVNRDDDTKEIIDHNDIVIDINNTEATSRFIEYYGGLKSVFIGDTTKGRPKIIFNERELP